MGKHFNAEIYRQFDRQMDRGLDEAMGDGEPPLTEAEKASQWDDFREWKCKGEVDYFWRQS